MATDLQKYRAQCLQVSSFCLMSPFGKLILNAPEYKLMINEIGCLAFWVYSIIAFLLFILGIIVMSKGEIHLQ